MFFFLIHFDTVGQQNKSGYDDSLFTKYADTISEQYSENHPYYISLWRDAIPRTVKITRRLDDHIAVIRLDSKTSFESISKTAKITQAINTWKYSPALERISKTKKNGEQKFILTGVHIDSLLNCIKARRNKLAILLVNRPSNSIVIKCTFTYLLESLLPLKEIIFIDATAAPHPETGVIGYDRSFHGINAVDYTLTGANGKSIVAGVKEQKMDEADIDLWKRVLPSPLAASTTSYHATVIASLIGGAGNSFYDGRGIAWGCNFFSSSFANLFADDEAVLNSNKVSVQNHSYGTIIQQFYGAEAASYDALTWSDKKFVAVISAGNQGTSFASEGKYANIAGYANLTGNFKMAKNVITVGAIDNNENVAAESSSGPLYDGRIAPQLIALGPNGTSDAAAIVTGTVAVMHHVYADSNSHNLPPASLIKSILYNTADDVYNLSIDYKTGYGLLNSYEAVRAVQKKEYDGGVLSAGQQWTSNIVVPVNAAELKLTLAWTDSAATVNNNKALINDLDLELTELSTGRLFRPWVLNAAPMIDSLVKAPVRARDSLNTAEQITIPLPNPGQYNVTVKGFNVAAVSIPFHIAYRTDTLNTFSFISPQHASDVNRAEQQNLTIRWKTFVADTNQTGRLYISYNSGATWDLIATSIHLAGRKYTWPIKDTNSVAVLKMETPFGDFFSVSFIVGKVTRLTADFNCVDSFRLSWNKHVYANAYRLYTLVDSPYLKPVITITDTFVVLQRSAYPWQVYAVEPLLTNGVAAARSAAIDLQLQGVQCFYKTLNYTLLDNNRLNLLLELSVAGYADSVFFERVTLSGQLLHTFGGTRVNNTDLIYDQIVDNLLPGITYLRGRIKLKNGSVVYTSIIQVLTSGKKVIWFYPNPVSRNTVLKHVLRQGISTSTRLQFFDATGRLLKTYSSLPDDIDVSKFPGGVIFYKLINTENSSIETGKLVVH